MHTRIYIHTHNTHTQHTHNTHNTHTTHTPYTHNTHITHTHTNSTHTHNTHTHIITCTHAHTNYINTCTYACVPLMTKFDKLIRYSYSYNNYTKLDSLNLLIASYIANYIIINGYRIHKIFTSKLILIADSPNSHHCSSYS